MLLLVTFVTFACAFMLVFVGNCFVVLRQGGYVFIGVLLFVC